MIDAETKGSPAGAGPSGVGHRRDDRKQPRRAGFLAKLIVGT